MAAPARLAAIMLLPLLLLLRAERRIATAPTPPPAAQAGEKPPADVGSWARRALRGPALGSVSPAAMEGVAWPEAFAPLL